MRTSFLYRDIAGNIEHKIETGVIKAGEKLPSVRTLRAELGVSMSTVIEAYLHLEGKGLVASYPRSGYYACSRRKQPAPPHATTPGKQENFRETERLVSRVYPGPENEKTVRLSLGVPAGEFLPVAMLGKEMHRALLSLPGHGALHESVQGNGKLRRQLALRSLGWKGNLAEDDLVITSGCMDALCLCFMALLHPGDTVAFESPVYFGLLQLAKGLGLKVLELPTDPRTGIDVTALEALADRRRIQACCLVSNFSNPLGSCIPAESKKEITGFLAERDIPLIEDDIYGDLYFGSGRPVCCKTFDSAGNVLCCGSVSKTLAPGYRVGWVAPGRYKEAILRQKLVNAGAAATLPQEAIATFLESGRYENHLRKLRSVLYANRLRMTDAVLRHFPEGTRISSPQGGFMLWVELPRGHDTSRLFDALLRQDISIAPGRMFTLGNQYENCMRLSYGLVWSREVEEAIATVGKELEKH